MNTSPTNIHHKGFSLIEMIIYISIVTVTFVIVVNTILSFTHSYRSLTALRLVEHTGVDAMERMSRDIRFAGIVDTANSTLGSSPGVLTIVSTVSGVVTTTKFYLQNDVVKVDVNGVYVGPLTISNTTVTSLLFTRLTNSVSSAVKVDMTVSATVSDVTKTNTYHSTIILKGT